MNQSAINEVTIVDTCTRLIFGGGPVLSDTEALIVSALQMDSLFTPGQSRDELGALIRDMGVDEMIALVGRTKKQLEDC